MSCDNGCTSCTRSHGLSSADTRQRLRRAPRLPVRKPSRTVGRQTCDCVAWSRTGLLIHDVACALRILGTACNRRISHVLNHRLRSTGSRQSAQVHRAVRSYEGHKSVFVPCAQRCVKQGHHDEFRVTSMSGRVCVPVPMMLLNLSL